MFPHQSLFIGGGELEGATVFGDIQNARKSVIMIQTIRLEEREVTRHLNLDRRKKNGEFLGCLLDTKCESN